MIPMLDVLNSHRSIRSYKADPVPDELLTRILKAGLRASSSGNMQVYSVILTTDEERRRELYSLHFNQAMVLEAPVVVTFCADFHRMRKWLKLSSAPDNFDNLISFMIGAIDAVIVAQTVAIAAESEGLGICYMGSTLANCQKIGRFLGCPGNVVPVVGFTLGYPNEAPVLRDRLPLDSLVHRETYNVPSDQEIAQTYFERETRGWERYMNNPELRARVKKLGIENLAQIYTKLKYTKESHEHYSQILAEYLYDQGFLNRGL